MNRKKETEKEKKIRFDKLRSISFDESLARDRAYCNQHGLTIYPAVQPDGRIFLFVQFGEKFKRLNEKVYNQDDEINILEYTADIYSAYREYANKRRSKNK